MAEPLSIGPSPLSAVPPACLRPSHSRYWVIVFAVALAIIQYIDRVCVSQAAPFISADLRLNEVQMGWVFSAFTLAYAVFEIPAGYLGDRIGPRKVLLRIVHWWLFTLMDTTMAWAVLSQLTPGYSCSTINLDIHYTRPAKGNLFHCAAEISHQTTHYSFVRSEIHDADGKLMALGQATFAIVEMEIRH